MTTESVTSTDFMYRIAPHFVVLLRISLRLTGNGRDATELMRDVIAEASQLFDETMSEDDYEIRLYDILKRQFFNGFQEHVRQIGSAHDDRIDERLVRNYQFYIASSVKANMALLQAVASDKHVNLLEAIVGLPEMFQSVMILSFVNGLSTKEVADLAGVHPYTIESLIDRGSGLLGEELFKLTIGYCESETISNRAAKSA